MNPASINRNKDKRLKFSLEVGSSIIDENFANRASELTKQPIEWVSPGVKNQLLMFNSLNDFKTDIKRMHKL